MDTTFSIHSLNKSIVNALEKQNITEFTEIQSLAIPKIMDGNNVACGAKTGTGKTLTYLLPVYEYILGLSVEESFDFCCIISVPSKELAFQISRQIELLSKNLGRDDINSVVAVGNYNLPRMVESLKTKPAFVIGSPNKLNELISLKKLPAHKAKYLVLDEADKLISKDSVELTLDLKKKFYKSVQLILATATYGDKFQQNEKIVNETLSGEIVNIFTSKLVSTPSQIKHYYVLCEHREKNETVRKVLKASGANKAIIFANKRYDIDEITQKLKYHNYKCDALHAEGNKFRNKNIVKDFESGKLQFIVASDYAARGMDFADVDVIINISLPEEATEYVHRSGRCGRNGKNGTCISIITTGELNKIKKFQKDLSINMVARDLYQGKLVAKK